MIAIEKRTGTHHVRPGFGTRGDGGAVGDVGDAGIGAEFAQAVECEVKAIELLARLMAELGVRENFGRGEMRERANHFHVFALGELASEAVGVFGEDAEAIHAGVHLELNGDIFLAQLRGGGFVSKKLLATVNCGSEIVLQEIFFLAGPETAENQDRRADAGLANFDALTGGGNAEPIRAGLFEGLGDSRATMAIAIAFDDGENLARSLALFRRED